MHTLGPWTTRQFFQTDDQVAEMKTLGMAPTRALTNDGSAIVMGPDGRVALVDCQTEYRRGDGHKTDCDERNANARLISAAPEMLAVLWAVRKAMGIRDDFVPLGSALDLAKPLDAAISKATGIKGGLDDVLKIKERRCA